MVVVAHDGDSVLLEIRDVAQGFGGLERDEEIGIADVGDHGPDRASDAHDGRHGAAALGHAVDFRELHVVSRRNGGARQQIGGENGALSADAAEQDGFR